MTGTSIENTCICNFQNKDICNGSSVTCELFADCGGILAMNTVDFQNLKSLRYPDPYPVDKECAVLITVGKSC